MTDMEVFGKSLGFTIFNGARTANHGRVIAGLERYCALEGGDPGCLRRTDFGAAFTRFSAKPLNSSQLEPGASFRDYPALRDIGSPLDSMA
ncbi:MAG: hypothetical protein U0942_10500 [Parvibaculum sp.]|uniref:hypothetical protein n=1 Tax=Parvibaculum sp. TaxID=2024848 RepID=UPI002ABCF6C6|nr:hypothetical protein [Parvibaculum sp.]MDZ4381758.1 hypothetical protein [Parvibaculum sp.]